LSLAPAPELPAWLRLNSASVFGPDRLRGLAGRLGVARAVSAPVEELAQAGGLSLEAAGLLREMASGFDAAREMERSLDMGLRLILRDDPDYPDNLKAAADAPLVLYARGRLDGRRHALAIVGSRQPTVYGRRMARLFACEAASRLVICSGLARGIDTEAHRAALDAGGTTWAVLGSGLGRLYPAENSALAREIVDSGGCLLSEFPIDAAPKSENFPRRNRVVSGLSWATVVVEGRAQSGALITARLAAEQGREVFAVPGPADSPLSEAPHRLISQGAKLVCSMADVWPELPPACQAEPAAADAAPERGLSGPLKSSAPAAPGAAHPAFPLASTHKKILELLGSDARSLEELGQDSGLDLSRLSQALFEMELQDLVTAVPGQRYAKKSS